MALPARKHDRRRGSDPASPVPDVSNSRNDDQAGHPLRTVEFDACTVRVYLDYVETTFLEDGSVSAFWPPAGNDEFRAGALHAGYPDTADGLHRHAVDHDLTHAFVADYLGWPHSWAVWSGAHATPRLFKQPWSQRVKDEEHLVVSLQRLVNTGLRDGEGCLAATFGDKLSAVVEALRDLLQPGWDVVEF